MKYKVMLFDADGVTLKSNRFFSDVYAEKFGVDPALIIPFFTTIFQDCMIGKADLKEELPKVLPDWKWSGSVDNFLDLWFKTEDDVNQGVVDLIKSLRERGVKCFLTTNQEKYRGQHLRKQLRDVFDDIFVSADVGFKKKDLGFYQEIFGKIEDLVGGDRTQILFIDDEEGNVEKAKEFGFDTIHYQKLSDLDLIKN